MKNKKLISIVISILLVISLTTTVFIATANAKEVTVTVTSDKQELKSGETATVSVAVTSNFPVATMSIPVFYDKTLVDVESCATPLDYDCAISTTDKTAVDSAKIYANTGIESEKFGFVLATYIAGAGDSVSETLTDTIVLTFSVKAKADVNGSAVFKVIGESEKTEENVKGMLYFGAQPKGNVIDEIPENVENVNISSVTVNISDGKNTLMLKEDAASMPFIDIDNTTEEFNGFIYGIDTLGWNEDATPEGTIADYLTTAYGDEYLDIIVGESSVETTGTVINVLDEDGNVVETYMFIYFGDVDMDGMATAGDGDMVAVYELLEEGINTVYQKMASDIDGDGMLTAGDGDYIAVYELLETGMPTQQEIAEAVSANAYA